jgi:hypothetical protein
MTATLDGGKRLAVSQREVPVRPVAGEFPGAEVVLRPQRFVPQATLEKRALVSEKSTHRVREHRVALRRDVGATTRPDGTGQVAQVSRRRTFRRQVLVDQLADHFSHRAPRGAGRLLDGSVLLRCEIDLGGSARHDGMIPRRTRLPDPGPPARSRPPMLERPP